MVSVAASAATWKLFGTLAPDPRTYGRCLVYEDCHSARLSLHGFLWELCNIMRILARLFSA